MKQTNSLRKRLLSALLALVCVLGLLPASAFAATPDTIKMDDCIGTFHVKWDNGRCLGVVMGQDSFSVQPPSQEQPHKTDPQTPAKSGTRHRTGRKGFER